METSSKRITGFDFARGLAITGMVFVNFKVVMSIQTSGILYEITGVITGKAAALFVVLAGAGMTLMYESAKRKKDALKIMQVKRSLLKRAAFLFVTGLSYYFIWPADILHYYGLYFIIGIFLLSVNRKRLIIFSQFIIVGYSFLLLVFDYEKGWNWNILEYTDFFTVQGFFRNLFFNGFHPVIPWIAFLLTGIWLGRINFKDMKARKRVMLISILIYIVFKGISMLLIYTFSALSPAEEAEIEYTFGTTPMPPSFFYMITASSLAVFIITISVYITGQFSNMLFVKQMVSTGQLALSNYVFHIVIGILGIQIFFGKPDKAFSIEFTLAYACMYNVLSIVFSHYWRGRFDRGPLEFLMRKITG
jgi:uncharacterized membrane protein YeiB